LNIAEQSFNLNKLDVRVETDRAFIADVSDIHVGNIYHNRTKFEDFISKVKSIDNLYLVIGGDSTDNATTSSASPLQSFSRLGWRLFKKGLTICLDSS